MWEEKDEGFVSALCPISALFATMEPFLRELILRPFENLSSATRSFQTPDFLAPRKLHRARGERNESLSCELRTKQKLTEKPKRGRRRGRSELRAFELPGKCTFWSKGSKCRRWRRRRSKMAISGFGKAEKGFVMATLGELMAMRHHQDHNGFGRALE